MQERRQGIRVLIFEYATEGLRDHCDAAEGAALVFALSRRCDAATLPRRWGLLATSRRCDAATPLGSPRVFATLRTATPRRCHVAEVSSRLRDAATLLRRWGGCSLLRSGRMLRRRERGCGGLLASSRLRSSPFGMKSWNPPCALNATTYKLSVLFLYYIVPGATIYYTYVLLSAYLPIPTYKPCKRYVGDM